MDKPEAFWTLRVVPYQRQMGGIHLYTYLLLSFVLGIPCCIKLPPFTTIFSLDHYEYQNQLLTDSRSRQSHYLSLAGEQEKQ